jgi:serine/threonine protein kinase
MMPFRTGTGACHAVRATAEGVVLGQRLHNFAIMRLLGEGGMSSVYEAEHELIRRKVAVKVLKSELSVDGAQVQRFFNEARATSAIRHPNIVEVIDVGRLADGVPYLVMELLEGESLGERLERLGSLDIPLALDFAHQAASALVAAHALNIVHRDLKPDNLFLVPDQRLADRELVKVLDFGIAKLRGDLAAPPFDTMVGAVLGTPPYMSPEQCRGLPEEIDERTDVYALGIILYEMLCGRPPFLAEGAGELMMMHMTAKPEPPSQLRADISPELERVILRALEKRREDRFGNMSEFDAAISEVSIAFGAVEPHAVRRSMPAAVGGRAPSPHVGPSFESDTTLSAHPVASSGDRERERAVTRALSRRPPPDTASGVVSLGKLDHPPSQPGVERVEPAEKVAVAAAEFDEEEQPTSQLVEVDVALDADVPDSTAPAEIPVPAPRPRAAAERSPRAWLPVAAGAACLVAALVYAVTKAPPQHNERSASAATQPSFTDPPAPASAPVPTPQSAPPSTAAPESVPAPAATASAPAEPPASTALASDPAHPAAPRPLAAVMRKTVAAPPPAAAKPERPDPPAADPLQARERADTAKPRRSPPPRAAALSMSDFEAETPQPSAAARPAADTDTQPAQEPGYLSLDSAPWSDVFLGTDRLGTTPLIRVPLPPGKYLLTLRNPELGASTSYAVEIQAGKTVSRLVGWEHR